MISNRNVQNNTLYPSKFSLDRDRYSFERFPSQALVATSALAAGGVPLGTTGATNVLRSPGGTTWECHIKGAGQTKIVPVMETDGLEIGLDLTDNEGLELNHGVLASSGCGYVMGTDRDCFIRAKFKVADVSGTDEFLVGFRIAAASNAASTAYTDYSAIGINTAANPAVIKTFTRLNSGSLTATATGGTWADAATHTFEVRLGANRKSSFFYDGVQVNSALGITHDSGDVMIPFIFYLHATTLPGKVHLVEYERGFMDMRRV